MLRELPAWCLFAGLLAVAASAFAKERVVVAPTVHFLKAVRDNPPSFLRKGVLDPTGFQGTVRFEAELSREEVARLEQFGVSFSRRFATTPDVDHIGTVYPVHVRWEGLDALIGFSGTLQIEPALIDPPELPLEVTGPLCTVPPLAEAVEALTSERPGEGVKIADIDHGIDVFHPSFFHADGGDYGWIDVDGDGELTFGTDAVDLDHNGAAGPAETLRYEDVDFIDLGDEDSYGGLDGDGHFEPDVDWLYADSNGNGRRDFGPDDGFSDQFPAFGEPLFVLDDTDQDGEADPGEALVRLSSSKIAKALVLGEEFVRGDNLTYLDPYLFGHDDWVPDVTHGTAVAGILAANTPGHSRLVGMAPYAEIYMVDFGLDSFYQKGTVDSDLNKLLWAAEQQVDIVLFEFGTWAITFLDGSTNLEHAMDELSLDKGIVQVAAAGNLGGKGKHMFHDFPDGETPLDVIVPRRWGSGKSKKYSPSNLYLSLYWEGEEEDLDLTLALPEGAPGKPAGQIEVPVHTEEPVQIGSDLFLTSFSAQSSRGFMLRFVTVFRDEGQGVPTGVWNWVVHNNTGADLPLHGYLKDSQTSWSTSVKFAKWKTSYTTLCHPATADTAITVGAYGARFCPEKKIGKLRYYSSRGPRMDGVLGLDIAAPADPYAPSPFLTEGVLVDGQTMFGGYREFSGTSGAAPHVAGTLALLKQLQPQASPAELLEMLAEGARVEHLMVSKNLAKKWGHGKLDALAAAFGDSPPEFPAAEEKVEKVDLSPEPALELAPELWDRPEPVPDVKGPEFVEAGPRPGPDGGCGCRAAGGPAGPPWALLLLLVGARMVMHRFGAGRQS